MPGNGSQKGRNSPERPEGTIQSKIERWLSPDDLISFSKFVKRRSKIYKNSWKPVKHFHRPPATIQIYLCAYLDNESSKCVHTHWTGRSIDMRNQPPIKSKDKLANKALDRNGKCKWCGSDRVVKNGKNKGRQLYRCKDCRHQFFDNGHFPRMRVPKQSVAFALEMYFDGQSLPKIAKNLKKFMGVKVSFQKIHEWIQKFVPQVDGYVSQFEPQLSGIWNTDETVIKFRPQKPLTEEECARKFRRKGEQYWHFDAIDYKTRFLVGSMVSKGRSIAETIDFFRDCAHNTPRPTAIITDNMYSYSKAINRVFYSRFKNRRVEHIHSNGFGTRMNNQLIERWHGTLKDRLKSMRGLISPDSQILRGFTIHYNFLRPHSSIGNMTPAMAAQINLPFENGWGDLIRWSTIWETLCNG